MNIIKRISLILVIPIFLMIFAIACGDKLAIESVTINSEDVVTIKVGQSMTFTATVKPEKANQNVEWSIDEGATATEATVSHTGVFNAGYVAGSAVLRATSEQDSSKLDTITINVVEDEVIIDVESITIEGESEISLKVNQTHTFSVIIQPENATNQTVIWSIEPGATATNAQITNDGVFSSGDVSGIAIVKAQWEDSENIYDTVTVTVTPEVESVSIDGEEERAILAGQSEILTITTSPQGLSQEYFVWEVVETDLGESEYVLEDGVFYAVNNTSGYAIIKVSYVADASIYDTVVININYNIKDLHTVKFYKEDGTTLIFETFVIHGESAVSPNYYVLGYEVTWDKPLDNITEDTDFVAQLSPIEYIVIYYKEVNEGVYEAITINGQTEQVVPFGNQATPPNEADYQVDGKTFINWRIEKEGNTFKLYPEYIVDTE